MEGFDIRSFHVNKPRCFFYARRKKRRKKRECSGWQTLCFFTEDKDQRFLLRIVHYTHACRASGRWSSIPNNRLYTWFFAFSLSDRTRHRRIKFPESFEAFHFLMLALVGKWTWRVNLFYTGPVVKSKVVKSCYGGENSGGHAQVDSFVSSCDENENKRNFLKIPGLLSTRPLLLPFLALKSE